MLATPTPLAVMVTPGPKNTATLGSILEDVALDVYRPASALLRRNDMAIIFMLTRASPLPGNADRSETRRDLAL